MKLTNEHLGNFVDKIKFGKEEKKRYQDQVDYLKSQLDEYICEHTDVSITKIIQAGSWKKGTILRPDAYTELDIDLAFYLDINKISNLSDLHEINSSIIEFLKKIYPTKSGKDFKENPKTANVKFLTSGLSVDIVPVIAISPNKVEGLDQYVLQPDGSNFEFYITSVEKQLGFITERKKANVNFSRVVRILKKWKGVKALPISSFAIELIVAYLDIIKGVQNNIEEALLRFFAFISNRNYPNIRFNAPYLRIENNRIETSYTWHKINTDVIYIADPTNNYNNVAKYISIDNWEAVREAATIALDTICYAQEKTWLLETVQLWKEVLGGEFTIVKL